MTSTSVTLRCETEDLVAPSVLPVVDLLLGKLHELRGNAPEAGEPIRGLQERDCRSLHAGRYRGVTWFDRERDVVWLLAAHIHRDDSHDDAYAAAIDLERAGRLYPTAVDDVAVAVYITYERQTVRAEVEAEELRGLRDRVLGAPSQQHQYYTSAGGLYVEMWAEVEPELALLTLRMRMFRRDAQRLTEWEVTVLLRGVFARDPYRETGDGDGRVPHI